MLIRKGYKKITTILSLILIFSFVVSDGIAYGESMFSDIDKKYWGYDCIEKMVNLGLMDGYEDKTFRPNDKISTVDTLVYVTRLMNIPQKELGNIREKQDGFLQKFNLSEDRKKGLAIALSKGLVTQKFVENNLFENGQLREATKVELSVYLVRAMGKEEEAKKKPLIFMYKDTDKIPLDARPHVKYLIDKGVLDEKGDGQNMFNPNQPITRAVLAKMLYLAYDQMNVGENITTPTETIVQQADDSADYIVQPVDNNSDYGELAGIIIGKVDNFLLIDNGQNKDSYKISQDIEILIEGRMATIDELKQGMNIKAKLDKDNELKSIKIDNTNDIIAGIIKTISLGISPYMEIELEDENILKTFYLSNKTKVTINGSNSYSFSLKEGDLVSIEALNNLALNIFAESKDGEANGILKDKKFDNDYLIVIEREDNTTYEYMLKDDLIVNRNFSKGNINDLRRGDKVKIYLRDGQVQSINAESVKDQDEGYIKEILISEAPKITIMDNKGELIDYYLSPDANIKIEKERKNIYDLRLGYFVKLELESDEIVDLELEEKTGANEIVGIVEYINVDGRFIVLKNERNNQTNNINILSNTTIKDMDGITLSLENVGKGNKVLITGKYDRGQFIAEKIIIVN